MKPYSFFAYHIGCGHSNIEFGQLFVYLSDKVIIIYLILPAL
jgi:hypothetical protein